MNIKNIKSFIERKFDFTKLKPKDYYLIFIYFIFFNLLIERYTEFSLVNIFKIQIISVLIRLLIVLMFLKLLIFLRLNNKKIYDYLFKIGNLLGITILILTIYNIFKRYIL